MYLLAAFRAKLKNKSRGVFTPPSQVENNIRSCISYYREVENLAYGRMLHPTNISICLHERPLTEYCEHCKNRVPF